MTIGSCDGAVEPFGDGELVGVAGPDRQHQIGGDDGDADGDERLPQFVAFKPAKNQDLHDAAPTKASAAKPAATPSSQKPVMLATS